jgi:hypothetical protein
MKADWGVLTSALDGGEWSASGPGRFTPRERSHGRRLGKPQNQSGRCGEEETLASAENRTPAVHPIACHYTD